MPKKSTDSDMAEFRPKVDYSLRPGKATVRRIIIEALARLGPLMPLNEYRYIGMGSTYFRDFQMIHRRLGVSDMITIEDALGAEDRVRFNLPLACIKVEMKNTNDALPLIRLEDRPQIMWFDYESRVNKGVLSDIEEAVGRCASASVLIVTVNSKRILDDKNRELWIREIGDGRAEPTTKAEWALLSYQILRDAIREALDSRNAARPKEQHIKFHQMFNMTHADTSQMLTVGGALVAETERHRWENCGIESLEFIRPREEQYQIKIPLLTRREVQHLLSAMPDKGGRVKDAAARAGIPAKDARDFASIYRYAPLFVEVEDW